LTSFSFTIFITSATVLAIRFSWLERVGLTQCQVLQFLCQLAQRTCDPEQLVIVPSHGAISVAEGQKMPPRKRTI
jgi:hypothetical protein